MSIRLARLALFMSMSLPPLTGCSRVGVPFRHPAKPASALTKRSSDSSCAGGAAKGNPKLVEDSVVVNYETEIRPLLIRFCLSCHQRNASTGIQALDFLIYERMKSNDFEIARKIVQSVESGAMPKPDGNLSNFSKQDQTLFSKWQADGFPESPRSGQETNDTSSGAANPPGSEGTTYKKTIEGLISSNCLSCHATGQQEPDLSTYKILAANNFSLAIKAVVEVVTGDMPRPEPLPSETVHLFEAWRDEGFREDNNSPRVHGAPDKSEDSEKAESEKDAAATDGCLL